MHDVARLQQELAEARLSAESSSEYALSLQAALDERTRAPSAEDAIASATAYARSLEQTVEALRSSFAEAEAYAKSLEADRDRLLIELADALGAPS